MVLNDKEQEQVRENENMNEGDIDIVDALHTCALYIDNICDQIDLIIEHYSQNNMQQANLFFSEFIEIIDIFVQMMNEIQILIKVGLGDEYNKSEEIQNLELHLITVLKALIPAKENEDVVMLTDLLEFELKENLLKWKQEIIPELINFWCQ